MTRKQLLLASLALAFTGPVLAQDETENDGTQSGYDDLAEFGGPEGVAQELKRNDQKSDPTSYQFDGLQRSFKPWFDWKRTVNDENNVSLGVQFYALYQQASESLDGEDDDAFGNVFRFMGSWKVFEQDNGNLGRFEWRAESRSNFGSFQAPGSLGTAIGVRTVVPGFGYSDSFDLDVPVLSWTQVFADGRAGYAVGRLAFDVYLDAFPFQTFSRGFLNRSFILNPTLPTTGIGAIGAVAKGFVTDNIWLGAQMHDANAASGAFDWGTVEQGEWVKAVEIGYTPSIAERNSKRVQLTYWQKDRRELAGTPKGSGWAVSAAYKLNDKVFPFVRFGHSDGGGGVAAETSLSAGVEVTHRFDRVFTIGVGAAKPSELTYGPGLDTETVIETSYKLQLSQNFSLTPDIQVIFNPAANPDERSVWVAGVRMIFTM